LQNFTHVILVELRDTRVAEVNSLRELITLYMDNSSSDLIAKEITNMNGRGVLFLLEGWDELPKLCQCSVFQSLSAVM